MNTIENTRIKACIEMLDQLKPSFATYAEAGEFHIKNLTECLGEEYASDLKMLTASALEKIASRDTSNKVVKLQGFGENSPYVSINHPAARAALLKGNDPITADE